MRAVQGTRKARSSQSQWQILAMLLVACAAWMMEAQPVMAQAKVSVEEEDPARAEALERYKEGREAYRDGKYVVAIERFEEAYKLKPNAKLLLFIARAYDKKGDSAGESLQYLERYASSSARAAEEVGPLLSEVRQRFRVGLINGARSRVMQAVSVSNSAEAVEAMPELVNPNISNPVFNDVPFSVRTSPPGADVYVDDREWGVQAQTPDTFPLFPGSYTLIVERNFYHPVEVKVTVEGLEENGNPQFVELELKRQMVPVTLRVSPRSTRMIYIGEDGTSQDLGTGSWEGELPAGPARFVLRTPSQGEREVEELILLSQRDETGRHRLTLDANKEGVMSAEQALTGTLEVSSYLLGGEVYVDGRKVGDTPGTVTATVAAGGHNIELRKPGFKPWSASLRIEGGEQEAVQGPETLERLPNKSINWGGWTFTTLGVGAAAAGGFFTLQGLNAQSDADGLLRPSDSDNGSEAIARRQEIAQLEQDAEDQHLIGYILYGAAGASLLTGILFFALSGDEVVANGPQDAPTWRLGAMPLPGGGSVSLGGQW